MRNSQLLFLGIFCVLTVSFSNCRLAKREIGKSRLRNGLRSEVFRSQFTGFVLYDPAVDKFIFDRNGDLYFTPASNTKILTALACLETFSDSIPSFKYYGLPDTLIVEPLADPTLLNPDFPEQPVFDRLSQKQIRVHFPPDHLVPFGAGWAWDDYEYSFQPQRSWFPLYGNQVRIYKDDSLHIVPRFFEHYVNIFKGEKPGNLVYREPKFNLFNIWMESDTSTFERKIPFDYSNELALRLLSDTLPKGVSMIDSLHTELFGTLYNQATVPVLGVMMQQSDNFLAEQLLIAAACKAGYRNVNAFREQLLSRWSLPSGIQWVDGSGLSRYNLVTPKTMVAALKRIYDHQPWSTITSIFPAGGHSGTIKNWYYGSPPYVFAKTGTLSNNHSLSGYIKTDSGKILIFSIMNNHYLRPTAEVKWEMQKLLEMIRKYY